MKFWNVESSPICRRTLTLLLPVLFLADNNGEDGSDLSMDDPLRHLHLACLAHHQQTECT
jgi:hypothetical protein